MAMESTATFTGRTAAWVGCAGKQGQREQKCERGSKDAKEEMEQEEDYFFYFSTVQADRLVLIRTWWHECIDFNYISHALVLLIG